MCPWVGPHAPSFGRQLWGLPSRAEYLSPQGVLLPLVYGTTASPLWLELRGHSAWQATPSWTVYRLACHRLLPWLRVTFAMVLDARDALYSRNFRSCFLSPADRFSFYGDALLLLPCSLRPLPGSGKFLSIMSHMETLIEAPDGYSLGFSSSSIPSGRSPSPGLSGSLPL